MYKVVIILLSYASLLAYGEVFDLRLSQKSKFLSFDKNVPFSEKRNYTLGVLRRGEVVERIQVKLHGDLLKHYSSSTPSFEVKIINSFGYTGEHFSLVHLEDKRYFVELILQEISHLYSDLIPKMKIIKLRFNSTTRHVLYREKISNLYLKKRLLHGSSVFKLRSLFKRKIQGEATIYKGKDSEGGGNQSFLLNPLLYSCDGNLNHYDKFSRMLTELRVKKGSQLLDESHLYNLLALQLLLGSDHSSYGDNLRWVYHEAEGKFKLIPYDLGLRSLKGSLASQVERYISRDPFYTLLSRQKDFRVKLKVSLRSLVKAVPKIKKMITSIEQRYPLLLSSKTFRKDRDIFIRNVERFLSDTLNE